ncbi:hypothetical protein VNO78_26031 [Psophocarpus tetragonolobus]|uniref:Uncharacterized protein n=1 Tax=Psophocarpus tetragonolobus TaxID=3891 RepID=A0AAN9RZI2_PSOTE
MKNCRSDESPDVWVAEIAKPNPASFQAPIKQKEIQRAKKLFTIKRNYGSDIQEYIKEVITLDASWVVTFTN